MITRERAVEILFEHGHKPDDHQYFPDENYSEPSFDEDVGVKDEYKLMEVLGWLGYCCRFC